jgi:RNA ligase
LSDERRYNIWFNNNYETGMERFFDPNNLPDFDNSYYEPTPKTKGEWIFATRGSFISEQSIRGKEILDKKYDYSSLRKDNTYLFEIIYPENRIVVDYKGEEKLVVLGVIHTETGEEVPDSSLFHMQEGGWELVTVYKTWGETYDILKEEISKDREGYVIRFKNGFRMKIKGEEYVRLHRILTNISNRDIWEYLKDNKPLDDLLEKVPDEFNDWVKSEVANFKEMYMITLTMAELTFIKFIKPEMSRKEAAEIIKTKDKNIQPILFKKLDNKDYSDLIWKKLYPSYSKPFKKNNEES